MHKLCIFMYLWFVISVFVDFWECYITLFLNYFFIWQSQQLINYWSLVGIVICAVCSMNVHDLIMSQHGSNRAVTRLLISNMTKTKASNIYYKYVSVDHHQSDMSPSCQFGHHFWWWESVIFDWSSICFILHNSQW